MDGQNMRYCSVISDLDEKEKMAFLAILLMDGTLSGREYVECIRSIFPQLHQPIASVVSRQTDWELVNRITANMSPMIH